MRLPVPYIAAAVADHPAGVKPGQATAGSLGP
jgi:hypothetical protein